MFSLVASLTPNPSVPSTSLVPCNTGLGMRAVVQEVISRTAASQPDRHVVVVVDRPPQALSSAAQLGDQWRCPVAA
jgi:hypothetical protein